MTGLISGFAISLVVSYVFTLPKIPPSSAKHLLFRSGIFAIIEELLFRYLLQGWIGIIPTALFWTVLHGFGLKFYTLAVFVIGIYLGFLMEYKGLIDVIAFHWVYNFVIYMDSRYETD